MKYTRTVQIEYRKEYDTAKEGIADEDYFLSCILVENGELVDNKLEDETGCEVLDTG